MTKLEEIKQRVKKAGVCGTPVFDDLLALCEEYDRELREAAELLRLAWDVGSYDSVGFANTADEIDAFLARHKENSHE